MENEQFTLARKESLSNLNEYRISEGLDAYIRGYEIASEFLYEIVNDAFNDNLNALSDIRFDDNVFEVYSNSYREFIETIYEELIDNHRIKFSNVDFTAFISKALSIGDYRPDRNPYNRNVMMMQYVSITSQVVEFLLQIVDAVSSHKSPAFKYMEIGARILGYTDRKAFHKMYNAMNSLNRSTFVRSLVDASIRNRSLIKRPHSSYFGERAAMADYSYSFKKKYDPQIRIAPVDLGGNMLFSEYDANKCGLKFGLGLQAALFELPHRPSDIVLSFAGTQPFGGRTISNVFTDLCQITYGPETTYLAAVGILSEVTKVAKDQIKVVGHSLGGGLMQYACTAIDDKRINGTGFNSAGLSTYSCYTLTGERIKRNKDRIQHVCAISDPVSKVGKQIGTVYQIDTHHGISHSIDDLNESLNKWKISCYM